MFVADRETLIAVRQAYLLGGRDSAATALRERWRGLDSETALMTVDEVLCWRMEKGEAASPVSRW
jgi:hypothetical protein